MVYLCGFKSFGMAGMDVNFGYCKEAFKFIMFSSCFLGVGVEAINSNVSIINNDGDQRQWNGTKSRGFTIHPIKVIFLPDVAAI